MFIKLILILSVLLQFGAFVYTISLIKKTKFNITWIAISFGFLLMAFRRLNELIALVDVEQYNLETIINSWTAFLISILMFIASIYLRQIFKLQFRINKIRKENEAKVLSAIIQTEEKERLKFSQELHDGLGPILSSVKMTISAINKSTIGETNENIISKVELAVDNAITSVKEISNNLSPHILERFGLEKAFKTFAEALKVNGKPEFVIASNLEGRRYDYKLELVLYRILGELFNNTLKYASASSVEISLFDYRTNLELFYSDNGKGYDMNVENKKGMGISNIKSRVKSLGGEIELHSKPNKGFFIKISLPLHET